MTFQPKFKYDAETLESVKGYHHDFLTHQSGNFHPTEDQLLRLHEIAELVSAQKVFDALIRHRVEYLRINQGTSWNQQLASWENIGHALGVSKQAAAKKYSA